jgi:hypothetical protein
MRVYFWVRSGLPAKVNSQAAKMSGCTITTTAMEE